MIFRKKFRFLICFSLLLVLIGLFYFIRYSHSLKNAKKISGKVQSVPESAYTINRKEFGEINIDIKNVSGIIIKQLSQPDLDKLPCFDLPNVSYDYTVSSIMDEVADRGININYIPLQATQKYEKITLNYTLNVIIIPTSHNDPGWLMTMDDYYYKKTKHILTNIVKYLKLYPKMTMIWHEVVFLEKWWSESSEASREEMKELVQSGRLEIICGGWVSPDEATTHYHAVLSQLSEGHKWLEHNLKIKPKNCWPLDQFGYSMTLPYLWSKAGIHNLGIQRITRDVKDNMKKHNLFQFYWRQQWESSGENDIFCYIEPFKWFTTEEGCGPDSMICSNLAYRPTGEGNDRPLTVDAVQQIINQMKLKSTFFHQDTILIPLGGDFAYDTDKEWFTQYNKMSHLMDFINQNSETLGVNMRFGTINDYFNAVRLQKSKTEYKIIVGDFYPYSEDGNDYWTGFFTTRPFDKRIGRALMESVRAAELLTSFALLHSFVFGYKVGKISVIMKSLQISQRNLALFQHHDAITGTSTHETATDYRKRLFDSYKLMQDVMAKNLENIFGHQCRKDMQIIPVLQQKDYDEPISDLFVRLEKGGETVLVWNSLPRNRVEIICVKLGRSHVRVFDVHRKYVQVQLNPVWYINNGTLMKAFQACFEVNVKPLAIAVYTITKQEDINQANIATVHDIDISEDALKHRPNMKPRNSFIFQNNYLSVSFSKNGFLTKLCIRHQKSRDCIDIQIDWVTYNRHSSDAYVYKADFHAIMVLQIKNIRIISGPLLTKVTFIHPLFEQTITMYRTTGTQRQYVEIENMVYLLSERDNGLELVMRIHTNIVNTDYTYFTDANGFQMVKRFLRPSMPSGANMYPMTSMAFIQDKQWRLTLHSAQPLGIGSFDTGNFQILIDRRPWLSGKGLTEPVLDNRPTNSKFFLQLENIKFHRKVDSQSNVLPTLHSSLINDILQHPLQMFLSNPLDLNCVQSNISFFKKELPSDIVLANVKSVFTTNDCWQGLGLTFHKRWIPCVNGNVNQGSKLSFSDIFNPIPPTDIFKSDLTFTELQENISKESSIHLKPMDLESYYFSWKQCGSSN